MQEGNHDVYNNTYSALYIPHVLVVPLVEPWDLSKTHGSIMDNITVNKYIHEIEYTMQYLSSSSGLGVWSYTHILVSTF